MITLKVNDKDLNRIITKLELFGKELTDSNGPVRKYHVYLLDSYKQMIVKAMGSVSMSGGVVQLSFDAIEASASTSWASLAPSTQTIKKYTGKTLAIWEATGDTKSSVQIYGDFAGIDGSKTREAYEKALNVEYGTTLGLLEGWGGEQPPRALFTVANAMFKANRVKILTEIKKRISFAKVKIKWGA